MARFLAVGLSFLLALGWGSAHALGLGEITLKSALHQKLDAEIELLDVRGLDSAEIVARLGTSEDFARVGVERYFFLTELRFGVESRPDGRRVLRVTSAQPITEPFVNFLVQVIWPNGRMLKEYTVLLDPPAFTEQAVGAVAAPGRSDPGGGPAGRVQRDPVRPDSQVSFSPPTSASRSPSSLREPQARLSGDSYGVTDRDDTLWTIASRARRGDATTQQTMLALVRLNPEAFIGGNINLLKAGYVLRLPGESEAKALDRAEAIAAVAEHNRAWQAYRQGGGVLAATPGSGAAASTAGLAGQVDATGRPRAAASATAVTEGELRILADDAPGLGGSGAGGTAAVEALEAQLAATEEEVERISRERDEALSQRQRAAAEIEQTQRQIEVRDQQIAQLQSQLKAAVETGAAAPPRTQDAGGAIGLLASPAVLFGGGAIVVLLLVAGLVAMRRRKAARDDDFPVVPVASSRPRRTGKGAPLSVAAIAAEPQHSDEDEPIGAEEPLEPALDIEERPRVAAARETEDAVGAQTSDIIGEADIYIAYGRYPQAVNLLLGALDEDPDRSDVRLKLLEVFAETRDAESFARHLTELVERCDDEDMLLEARDLEAKLRESPAAVSAAAPPPTPLEEPEPEFDLELEGDDTDVHLELDLDREESAPSPAAPPAPRTRDDLGGDLGIDFDPDRPRAGAAAAATLDNGDLAVAEGDDEFDLEGLELDEERSVQPKRTAAGAADDAFDFLDQEDTASTKLDLARAYIDMGDDDGAREILSEVVQEGSAEQRKIANELLAKLA
jgi:pilus assembly protein FimV